MSSIPYSSVYIPSTPSISSLSSNHDSLYNDTDPTQTQNLDVFMDLLDDRQVFAEISRLVDGRVAFQKLFTIDHIHSTIRTMEQEIRRQKMKATVLFDQLIKEKKSKQLRRYFREQTYSKAPRERKYTPPASTSSKSNSSKQSSPEPIPIPPPRHGSITNPIVVTDEEFPSREPKRKPIVDDWEGEIPYESVKKCKGCGSTRLHPTKICHYGMVQDPESGFWYDKDFLKQA